MMSRQFRFTGGSDEVGKTAEIIGRGATGNSVLGEFPDSPHAGVLCRAYSRIISADERWLECDLSLLRAPRRLKGCPRMATLAPPFSLRLNTAENSRVSSQENLQPGNSYTSAAAITDKSRFRFVFRGLCRMDRLRCSSERRSRSA